MSSKATEKASRLTTALIGVSVAVGVAREATDAVPIVKQCLGSAMRIVAFAEKMDKDRKALRELAEQSIQLARRVKDVMDGRTPNAKVATSLERILKSLESIEMFMSKHSAHSRLYRLIGYAFTVPQHVERLSRELGNAVQDLVVVVLLDVNHHVHTTHTAVHEDARFVGEFRLLRHCEVQKLDHIFDFKDGEDSNAVVRYHRAQVDGQLLVVRYFEGSIPQPPSSVRTPGPRKFDRIAAHDRMLEEISTVQISHPNVARIYGWNQGARRNRFTVFKSGHQPVDRALQKVANPTITGIQWAFQLLDAVKHLQSLGIFWCAGNPAYALDDQLQPTIGLRNDLARIDKDFDEVFFARQNFFWMIRPLQSYAERQFVPAEKVKKFCPTKRLANLVGRMGMIQRDRHIFPTDELSDSGILTDTAAEGLLIILEDKIFAGGRRDSMWTWANILLASDKKRSHKLIPRLQVVYFICELGEDRIHLYGVDQDSECIVHDKYSFNIPDEQREEIRELFGIAAPSEGHHLRDHIIATGAYCMPE